MQKTGVTKVLGAGIAAFVAMIALWGALFATQPAYAASEADLGAGSIALATQVQGPTTATVRIGESLTVSGIKNVASDQGTCTWTAKSSSTKIAKATVKGSGTSAKLTVKGVADGTATITVTCKNGDGLTASHAVKVKVTGIKNKVNVGGLIYKRTGINTVSLIGTKSNKDLKKKSIKVPNTIKVQDAKKGSYKASYKVTAVGKAALTGQRTTKTITVGNNVKTIGAHAFCGNYKLAKLVIGKNVKKLGAKMVHVNNKKLKTITIKSTKLTKSGVKNCLAQNKYVKTIKAPAKMVKKYKKFFTKKNCGKKVTVKK